MTIDEIRLMPNNVSINGFKCHESVMRSYHILESVKDMLIRKDSPETIYAVIMTMSSGNGGTKEYENL